MLFLILFFYIFPAFLLIFINYFVGLKAKIKANEEKIFPIILNLALAAVLGPIQTIMISSPVCVIYEGHTLASCANGQKDILSQLIMPGIIIYIIMFFIGLSFFKFGRAFAKISKK